MPQLETIPGAYSKAQADGCSVTLESQDIGSKVNFSFECIRPNIFRTTFFSESHPVPPHPSIVRPSRDASLSDSVKSEEASKSTTFETAEAFATVEWRTTPIVSVGLKGATQPLQRDLDDRSYVLDGNGVAHYSQHDRAALHVGMGEKAAPMDLTGRQFIISATDCFGYDVHKTDPTYKHLPLLVKTTPEGCVAIFSASYSRGSWSVGAEIDGLWGHFKTYRQDYGGLEEYLIVGKTLKDVVRSYAEIAGYPLLAPKWAYGYISGGYRYTMGDTPQAYLQLNEFADKLAEHDIPCSAHQMSSGYSIAEKEPKVRNVFNWNYHRFPDPEAWIKSYHERGIRLLCNIKPFILYSHPDYKRLKEAKGLFIDNRTKDVATMKLWSAGGGESGLGSHVDFTNSTTYDWWYKGVQLMKSQGIDGMWNDNNEYTLPNDLWQMSLSKDGKQVQADAENMVGLWGRNLHTELMGKASHDALLEMAPHERPFVLTRSSTSGAQRYCASSWSGDNVTSWAGMKGANAQSLNAGISLIHCYGHDIGGFEGPQPSPELLLRWIQLGIHSPRFAINCFKTSPRDNQLGEVIEPWMYPHITPHIRKAIKRRYEILPYIYSLGLESHMFASPPQRWTGWDHEMDPEVWTNKLLKEGEEQYWFGSSLLVGGVYEPGVSVAKMYLPRSDAKFDYGYVNTHVPYEYFASGQWVEIQSVWTDSIPIVARVGTAVPVGKDVLTLVPGEKNPQCNNVPADDWRGVEIFPPKASSHGQTFESTWYEDDGISNEPTISPFTVRYSCTEEKIVFGLQTAQGDKFVPPWKDLDIILLPGDERHMVSDMAVPMEELGKDKEGRARWRLLLSKA